MATGDSANKAVGQVLFGTFAGGITAELSGGNFWQGAATGMVVSLLNHVAHEIEINLQDSNEALAKQIAKEYGYDWREVKAFLDKHPFVPTDKGIKFLDYEAVSSKFEGSGIIKLVNKYGDDSINKGFGMILKKIIGKSAGQALSSTSLQEQEPPDNALRRAEECKRRLIEHVFRKPMEYQTPSMFNNMQSWKPHSSIYDKLKFRNY